MVNYTWDGTAWVKDFDAEWYEKRICLNTATPTFTAANPLIPTFAEVQTWAANLPEKDRLNGTHLVYFIAGQGGDCDTPDYTWVLNKGSQLISLVYKREYNGRVHYLTTKGNDDQALVGYPNHPYKNFDVLLNNHPNYENGDIVHIRPGTYVSNTAIPIINREINLYLEDGVKIINNAPHFLGVNPQIYSSSNISKICIQGNGEIVHQNAGLTRLFMSPYDTEINVKIKKLTLGADSNQSWGFTALSKKS